MSDLNDFYAPFHVEKNFLTAHAFAIIDDRKRVLIANAGNDKELAESICNVLNET